jgi:hypothetical protein
MVKVFGLARALVRACLEQPVETALENKDIVELGKL